MIPRLHPKGHSFKGAAAYLLHDKQADTAERVAWVETRNLATENGHVAWKIMAATAQSQERLKAQAGIKNTGRKSNAHVLHFSLSWSADEAHTLTREEMIRAAKGALRALSATDRQAIIVAHNDEPHPHVHILLNRVSADDGRMLSSSKEKLALSEWALGYERERGLILCEERLLNHEARQRGEFTRDKERSRAQLEDEKRRGDQPRTKGDKAKLAELAQRGRELAERHATAWRTLEDNHKAREREIRNTARRSMYAQEKAIRERFRDDWTLLFHEHQAERLAQARKENTVMGRVRSSLSAVDFGSIMRAADRRAAISKAFQLSSSTGARLEELKRIQSAQSRELAQRQQSEERRAASQVVAERQRLLTENRHRYLAQRSSLQLTQNMEDAALRASWNERSKTRAQGRTEARAVEPVRRDAQRGSVAPVGETTPQRPNPTPSARESTKPAEQAISELPSVFQRAAAPTEPHQQSGSDDRARRMVEHAKRMKEKEADHGRAGREREIDRDR